MLFAHIHEVLGTIQELSHKHGQKEKMREKEVRLTNTILFPSDYITFIYLHIKKPFGDRNCFYATKR